MPLRSGLRQKVTDAFATVEADDPAPADALFDEVARSGELRRLPLDHVSPRVDQPRQSMDPEAMDELVQSIRDYGVLQPIRVRRKDDGAYEIIAGERRWTAANRAGLRDIPAIVVTAEDGEAYIEALIENIQREDLNLVDRAHALKRLRVNLGSQSWEDVGKVVGITRRHVHNLLNITRLPEKIQEDMRVSDLTEKHGRALVMLRGYPQEQMTLWNRIHKDQLTGDAALTAAREIRPTTTRTAAAGAAGRSGVTATASALLAALDVAAPSELEVAAEILEQLRIRLAEVGAASLASATTAGAEADGRQDA